MNDEPPQSRYFLTYTGVRLPLRLVGPLAEEELANRNTFIRAQYDGAGRLTSCEKFVYGEIELTHRYWYRDNGSLERAEITVDDEVSIAEFGVTES